MQANAMQQTGAHADRGPFQNSNTHDADEQWRCSSASSCSSNDSAISSIHFATSDEEACWICLGESEGDNPLQSHCRCAQRKCHAPCLARWQLHSAGKSEEKQCRFCGGQFADWRPVMTESMGCKQVTPYMRVSFGGRTYKVQVRPGCDGAADFEREIRRLLQLPASQEFDVIFHCRAPGTGDKLQLQGLRAFDAAVHCASLSRQPTASQAPGAAQQARDKAMRRSMLGRVLQRMLQAAGFRIE